MEHSQFPSSRGRDSTKLFLRKFLHYIQHLWDWCLPTILLLHKLKCASVYTNISPCYQNNVGLIWCNIHLKLSSVSFNVQMFVSFICLWSWHSWSFCFIELLVHKIYFPFCQKSGGVKGLWVVPLGGDFSRDLFFKMSTKNAQVVFLSLPEALVECRNVFLVFMF